VAAAEPDVAEIPTIETLDRLSEPAFAGAVAPLFEGAPRFLARLAGARPFGSVAGLFERAREIALAMPVPEQLELIDAHPRLGAPSASVSALSFVEQGYGRASAGAAAGPDEPGLAAEPDEPETTAEPREPDEPEVAVAAVAAEFDRLNVAYEARFGFRYCVFVAGRPRAALLPEFRAALDAPPDAERRRALAEVVAIAHDRYRKLAGGSTWPSSASTATARPRSESFGSTVRASPTASAT
jgi:2-oxo-4-hydroxy-4-carboxy--5-ureidoimidazoline (OHCU) decarboxylase